jgi:hypothetical protein
MSYDGLLTEDWADVVERLGGAEKLDAMARQSGAFRRSRGVKSAVDLLRILLSYCLGKRGLRATAAWGVATGLMDISNVALLKRLRNSGDWLAALVSQLICTEAPPAAQGRLIRAIDGTAVPQAGPEARKNNKIWRIHSAFDLPGERFSHFELTDQQEGECLDRIPVVKGEIRLGDRAYLQPDRIAVVLEAGADIVVRAGWKSARWRDNEGQSLDIISVLREGAISGVIDRPIQIARKGGDALHLRLVAIKKPPHAAEEARRLARRNGQREGYTPSQSTLEAADWVLIVTSLSAEHFKTNDVLALYRLRWRIELAFKRLKSLVGLTAPPGFREDSAKPYILAHLLMILLLEPLLGVPEVSPRSANTQPA